MSVPLSAEFGVTRECSLLVRGGMDGQSVDEEVEDTSLDENLVVNEGRRKRPHHQAELAI